MRLSSSLLHVLARISVPARCRSTRRPRTIAPLPTRRSLRTSSSRAATPRRALPLKDTSVDVAITGVIADVTVRQMYGTTARGRFTPATFSGVDARRGLRHDDDGRRRAHRGANQGAREAARNSRRPSAKARARRCSSRPAQRLHDERRQHPARRHDRGRARLHRAARADRGRLRVRLPDGGRAALREQARKQGVAGRPVRQGAVHPPGRGAAQRVPSLGRRGDRRAAPGARVAVAPGRLSARPDLAAPR